MIKRYGICILIIALFVVPSLSYAQTDNVSVVGTWKLLSIDRVFQNGEVMWADEWFGKNPIGLISYDTNGYMSVQLMRNPQEKDSFESYYAYFGSYEVKAEKGKEGKEGFVLHYVQGSLRPGEVGITYNRHFTISENRLILTAMPPGRRFTFERAEKVK